MWLRFLLPCAVAAVIAILYWCFSGDEVLKWRILLTALALYFASELPMELAHIRKRFAQRPRVAAFLVRLVTLKALWYLPLAAAAWTLPSWSLKSWWLLVPLFGAGPAVSLIRIVYEHSSKLKAGHCRVCDYDLTGNVSGRCPECGTPIAAGTEAAAPPGPAEVKKTE